MIVAINVRYETSFVSIVHLVGTLKRFSYSLLREKLVFRTATGKLFDIKKETITKLKRSIQKPHRGRGVATF